MRSAHKTVSSHFYRTSAIGIAILGLAATNYPIIAQSPTSITGPSATSVQGVIKTNSGQTLANATVILFPADPTFSTILTKTSSTGAFNLSGIAPGTYTICPEDADNKHLNPCYWASGAQITVGAGQTISNTTVSVTPAATLQVRVDDPKQLSDPKSGATVVAVILPNGKLAPMNLSSSDSGGKTYRLAVPPGTHKVLFLNSSFKIADGSGQDIDKPTTKDGKLLAPTVDAPVSVTSGTSYVTVTLTGKR